jgi:hypothetical protein
MDDSYLKLAAQAESLCFGIAGQIVELEAIEAAIALEDKQQAGGSGLIPAATSTPVRQEKQVVAEALKVTDVPRVAVEAVAPVAEVVLTVVLSVQVVVAAGTRTRARAVGRDNSLEFEEFGTVSENEDAGSLNFTSAEAMLKRSIRPSTEAKYARLWDKWAAFALHHEVETMPPEMRALEIFIVDTADLAGSAGVANSTTPFTTPRFMKIFRAIRLTHSKQVRPKKPFMWEHVIEFMKAAQVGSLLDWRAALPLALCYQQLLRRAECFDLDGSNVVRHPGFFSVQVQSSKNIPEGFDFKVIVDRDRPHCVGQFMADFIVKTGIVLGDGDSYKILAVKGVLTAVPKVKVVNSTMRAACKRLI